MEGDCGFPVRNGQIILDSDPQVPCEARPIGVPTGRLLGSGVQGTAFAHADTVHKVSCILPKHERRALHAELFDFLNAALEDNPLDWCRLREWCEGSMATDLLTCNTKTRALVRYLEGETDFVDWCRQSGVPSFLYWMEDYLCPNNNVYIEPCILFLLTRLMEQGRIPPIFPSFIRSYRCPVFSPAIHPVFPFPHLILEEERIRGVTLRKWVVTRTHMAHGPFLLSILSQILVGLHIMHEVHGIQHNDLHSKNIFLTLCPEESMRILCCPYRPVSIPTLGWRPKIIDWGHGTFKNHDTDMFHFSPAFNDVASLADNILADWEDAHVSGSPWEPLLYAWAQYKQPRGHASYRTDHGQQENSAYRDPTQYTPMDALRSVLAVAWGCHWVTATSSGSYILTQLP